MGASSSSLPEEPITNEKTDSPKPEKSSLLSRSKSMLNRNRTRTAPDPSDPLSVVDGRRPSLAFIDNMISKLLLIKSTKSKKALFAVKEIEAVCTLASEILLSQPSLLEVSTPVSIVGDIHGQYLDLLNIFRHCGMPSDDRNYLFLGDYVDRGSQSLETILLLLCFKVKYPETLHLLRGNHECAGINKVYGFFDECKRKYNVKLWKTFTDVFNCLPIAAIVEKKVFCVHGGLSPILQDMRQIQLIKRPTEVPDSGLISDLLWSDPSRNTAEWEDNERGVSFKFGKPVVRRFLLKHGFDLVCRAHMVVEDGYEFFGDRSLVTIFSAPNYCGEFDNVAAILKISEKMVCSFQIMSKAK